MGKCKTNRLSIRVKQDQLVFKEICMRNLKKLAWKLETRTKIPKNQNFVAQIYSKNILLPLLTFYLFQNRVNPRI